MREYSSFRDPSGFIFYEDSVLYRQINQSYRQQFEKLTDSGLYEKLVSENLIVKYEYIGQKTEDPAILCVIKPERVPFISYPYEWSFGQLKDAALATLRINRLAADYGMILKDASAYNIQFVKGAPKLIDSLSFDFYEEGKPWIAYGQFCRHFLAPLFLAAQVDIRLLQLMRVYIDGIPIDLASKLLKRGKGFGVKQHIHWHAKSLSKHSEDGKQPDKLRTARVSRFNYIAMIDSLIRTVDRIQLNAVKTEWMDYYDATNYSNKALNEKEAIVARLAEQTVCGHVWDLGANDGRFSRIVLAHGAQSVVAFDIDPIAVERNYQKVKNDETDILPLILDLTNPSPGIGFANKERLPADKRQKPDCILALALIHHLAISNNLPFEKIAEWLAGLTENLIIEFVPKSDSQVRVLLATRDDIFNNYTQMDFEAVFKVYFDLVKAERVTESERTIYLFKKKENAHG